MNGPSFRILAALAVALCPDLGLGATLAPGRTAFPDSFREISPVAANSPRISRTTLTGEETNAVMSVEVALRMRNFDEMQQRIANGELISASEKQDRFFPLAADHDRVLAWLKSEGLEVTRTDSNHLGIFVRGPVSEVARAFGVSFARVATADGREFTSAVTVPSLPDSLSAAVLGVHGLQPHIRRRPFISPQPPTAGDRFNLSGYLPSQISAAYNATGLSVDGTGQTIAIYSFAFPAKSDLTQFWSTAQVKQTANNVQMISVGAGPASSPSTDSQEEAALDVEWAGALAPGANIRVYGANENDPAENDEILQQVYADLPNQPTMHVLSISIGGNELDVPKDYLVLEAQYLANLASAGVTILVASGDLGAMAEGEVQTTYPTSDPDVTGVGGTTLVLLSNNTVSTESGWSGSGGGVSIVFNRPSWQTGPGVAAASGGTTRLVPDVAAAADPQDGALIIVGGQSGSIGGTSWSAPTWAGFCALLNQQRGTPLGLLNPKIYPLNNPTATPAGSTGIRDITSGSNGTYSAAVGYDLVTGIGVPNVTALLAANLTSSPAAVIPAQLGDQAVVIGQPATFYVVGYGASPLAYQWQRMASGSTTWAILSDSGTYSGSAGPTLTVNGTTSAMTGDQFRCVVSNGSGSSTSTAANLTINKVGVTTLAGWPGTPGDADGAGRAARFAYDGGLRNDSSGNLYVSDSSNYTIRKVTPAGAVTTYAGTPTVSGSADGPALSATFAGVGGVGVDGSGNVYVADSGNYTIRKISASGVVSTLAGVAGSRGETDGTGASALFYDPQNLAVDASGNIYVADGMGDVVRMVTPAGVVTTLAGKAMASGSVDGTGSAALFNDPTGIAVDILGNIYVADNGNETIRKIAPGAVVTTLAGKAGVTGSTDGSGAAASFSSPAGVGADSSGNVYVADSGNDTIRVVSPAGFVATVAGLAGDGTSVDGLPTNARFNTSGDVCVDNSGVVYVADAGNSTVRRIIPGNDSVPFLTAQPASQSVTLGSQAILTMGIAGTAPFTFQWALNGAAIPGATLPYYKLPQAQESDAGSYRVTITNVDGSVTSSAATLTVTEPSGYPDITAQPVGGPLASGGSVVLSVTVTGNGPFSYQWMLNGSAISGATGASYAATAPGSYTVSITNAVATSVSSAALVGPSTRLINVSTRAMVGTGSNILIPGFVVAGSGIETLLIRADGPALTQFSVGGVLAQPTLSVFDKNGTVIASNTGWGTNSNPALIASTSAQVGAFALASGSADCAVIVNLVPGNYTVQVTGVNNTTGVALAEIYEVSASGTRLSNISTRAMVGTGSNILIPGFVISGSGSEELLVRADGPSLSQFQVSGVLAQTTLGVYSGSTQIASNTGWSTSSNASQIATVSGQVGAFAFAANSGDSAQIVNLPASASGYTIQISGVGNTSGVALAELYEVGP